MKLAMLIRFFFNDTATAEIYTLALHDALPISMPLTPFDELVLLIVSLNEYRYFRVRRSP